jgi:hypothetical protein
MKKIANAAVLVLGLLLAGCAAASPSSGETISDFAVGMEAPAALGGADFAPVPEESFAASTSNRSSFADQGDAVERVVIRTASMSLVVESPTESMKAISQLADEMGGFVVSSNVFQTFFAEAGVNADQGSITIRVPADRLDQAIDRIQAGAIEVRSQNVSGQDVTQEFTDLQSRLRNLEAAEEQLLDIMANADKTEDVLNIFNNLRQVREEIEVIQGRIQYLSESAALSAISVDLIPDVAAAPLQIGGWRPEGTAKEAFTALVKALRGLGNIAIWAGICVLPVTLILGVPSYFAGRSILRRRREAKATAENSPQKKG